MPRKPLDWSGLSFNHASNEYFNQLSESDRTRQADAAKALKISKEESEKYYGRSMKIRAVNRDHATGLVILRVFESGAIHQVGQEINSGTCMEFDYVCKHYEISESDRDKMHDFLFDKDNFNKKQRRHFA
jgi:hypothetical protein